MSKPKILELNEKVQKRNLVKRIEISSLTTDLIIDGLNLNRW